LINSAFFVGFRGFLQALRIALTRVSSFIFFDMFDPLVRHFAQLDTKFHFMKLAIGCGWTGFP
tara:strand:- start:456 stop:644 length:189 start_codon:yes stop_codon:yes gene_type:complete